MIEEQKEKFKKVRDKHYPVIRNLFMLSSGLLLIMSFVILITGFRFAGLSELDKGILYLARL